MNLTDAQIKEKLFKRFVSDIKGLWPDGEMEEYYDEYFQVWLCGFKIGYQEGEIVG